ncbi:hypothetical protein N0B44_19850 [Roseibacterium beibuensis]|uniref:calcium-binding protein n=1 Tax=[Roseibacterium] beibuensis TaxID=1193142 RepID=UPI00217D6E80|nr:calcium-binding protein [Roseibacterium beibuensis]MCS6625172.1 hypothetical protein [Roseibacterium beibuensis]
MPTYTGTNAGETITGSAGDDLIDGLGGADDLFGLEGQDVFTYRTGRGFSSNGDGDGADVIEGGDGADRLDVLGDVLQTFRTNSGVIAYPTYALTAAGADALFTITQVYDPFGSAPPVPATRVVTTRGVESISFNFTHDTPLPTQTVPGISETRYSTNDVLTIGDLSGTAMTGQIDFDGGHGDDALNASAAINRIVAQGGVGDDDLTTGAGDDELFGGDGADVLFGGGGDNILSGGASLFDTANYAQATEGVHVDLNDGIASNNGMGGTDTLSGIEWLIGSAHNDVLIGEGSDNRLIGGHGSDYLIGLDGDDHLEGGAGAANALQGGMGDDTYIVDAVGDTLIEFAGQGYDQIVTTLTSLTMAANIERMQYSGGHAFIGRGNDVANLIIGGGLVDSLYGAAGDDVLYGLAGSDHLYGGAGNDTLDGGAFSGDTANYSQAAGGVYVNLTNGVTSNDGDGGVDTLISIESATGSAFNDVLIGESLGNILNGGLGSDVLVGLAGDDILIGGAGAANQMQGGLGNDTYRVSAAGDSLIENAGEGNDRVEVWLQSYVLKDHFETLVFMGTGAFTGTGNSLGNGILGGASNDILSGLGGHDGLGGGGGNDVLFGGLGNDGLAGDAGDDTLWGGDGNDYLEGGTGSDLMIGGAGDDAFDGGLGDGVDIADYSASAVGLTLRVAGSNSDGLGGTDTLINMEGLIGTAFNDTLVGDAVSNTLSGGLGTDLLLGFGGGDVLIGGSGAANQMQGGQGDDRYVTTAVGDTLVEFAGEGTDVVDTTLSAYTLRDHFENLTYTGAGAFTGVGNAAANILTGAGGADTFTGRQGNDTVHGGGGIDTVVMAGLRADYTIHAVPGGFTIVDSVGGRDGIDTLYDVERIRFSDGEILDPTAPAAPSAIPEALLNGPEASFRPMDDIALTVADPGSAWNDF